MSRNWGYTVVTYYMSPVVLSFEDIDFCSSLLCLSIKVGAQWDKRSYGRNEKKKHKSTVGGLQLLRGPPGFLYEYKTIYAECCGRRVAIIKGTSYLSLFPVVCLPLFSGMTWINYSPTQFTPCWKCGRDQGWFELIYQL